MFADIDEKTTFAKRQWLSIKEGKPVLFQILDDKPEKFIVHTIHTSDGWYLKVPHRDDSVLMREDWFNKQYPRSAKYQVNVLEVTPYIVNPASGFEASAFQTVVVERDPINGDDLRGFKRLPLNRVKILESGVTLFGQLNTNIAGMLAENPGLDFKTVVFLGQASGSHKKKVTSVYPRTDIAPQDISECERFELTISDFSDEEISSLLKGVTAKEIFAARRSTEVEDDAGGFDFSSSLPGLL